MSGSRPPVIVQGRYDLRQGAGGYAPIVGALGALAVPGIVVLFTVPAHHSHNAAQLITLAAGFLIISVIASLIGSVSLAGIAAAFASPGLIHMSKRTEVANRVTPISLMPIVLGMG